ncbi:predicted protein [Lichtheimia corymbifera JMRC:FSU:9682]|uniref:Uncharacterized protein n=1 Tax=Lichtheimia corymbifera JMRC:FSU:9682 TaxID=1263082 RepID=A0A068RQS2_9FUNG|nr:predicted protein [Lichtheimia corymbifera JMRC:FSU:9682]
MPFRFNLCGSREALPAIVINKCIGIPGSANKSNKHCSPFLCKVFLARQIPAPDRRFSWLLLLIFKKRFFKCLVDLELVPSGRGGDVW